MDFVIGKAVGVAVDGGVDAKGEDVLVVRCEHARVDDGSPWYFDAIIDGLSADDAGGSNLVRYLAGLVEYESHDVFVVGNSDDRLHNEFSTSHYPCYACTVVRMLPADAGVLLMDADDIFHWLNVTLVSREDSAEIVDGTKAVAAELQIVSHGAGTSITEVKGRFLVERRSRISVGDVHV